MSNNLIVIDIGNPEFMNNRILDPDYASRFPGASVIPCLHNIAREAGWNVMTADVFLSQKPSFYHAVCWSSEATPLLRSIINRGVEPVLLSCGESPNVAWHFYHELPARSKPFRHAVLFRGIKDRCSAIHFHQSHWPCDGRNMLEGVEWGERDVLCMIASSKSKTSPNWNNPLSRMLTPKRCAQVKLRDLRDPYLKVEDLYEKRLVAIEYFAGNSDFRLFGRGWGSAIKHCRRLRRINFINPPLECKNKLKVMERHRFALCFENCSFPGYITEKIFDCFFAGVVPVYWGAPDITDFVPHECFIDYREYRSFPELWNFLVDINYDQWSTYRNAIRSYLSSDMFTPFKDSVVAEKILKWLIEE